MYSKVFVYAAKNISNTIKHTFAVITSLLLLSLSAQAEELPAGYYDAAIGKKDANLKTALRTIIRRHTALSYGSGNNSSWYCFYYSDQDSAGYCMDMYCDDWKRFTTPGAVVAGCNVEHSFAKSWWGGANNDAYKDCYHLNPSNANANSARSNYPLGVPTQDVKVVGSLRVGKATYNGQIFRVFEPKDEYKGDFARAYFYMATCYGDELTWRKDNADVGSYYAMRPSNDLNEYLEFLDWEIDVLLAWHRMDPVSEKELNRADAVSNFQHNRNPFIDYPCLAEYIWGEHKGEEVVMSQLKSAYDADWQEQIDKSGCLCVYEEPTLISPSINKKVDLGTANKHETISQNLFVRSALLTNNLQLTIEGTDAHFFTLDRTTVTADEANEGVTITINYTPTSFGNHSANLCLRSTEVARCIEVQGVCEYHFQALPATDITESGFTANWIDAEVDSYMLDVYTKTQIAGDIDTLVWLPKPSQNAISAAVNIAYSGNTFDDTDGIRLGTGKGDGAITISNLQITTDGKLYIKAKTFGSDASSLSVKADNNEVAVQKLTTTDTEYTFAIPTNTTKITLSQGTTGKRVVISSILLTQGGLIINQTSVSGFPIEIGAATSFNVQTPPTDNLYYTVTPKNSKTSNEVKVIANSTETSINNEWSYNEINVTNRVVTIYGIALGTSIAIYDAIGRLIEKRSATASEEQLHLHDAGIYVVRIGNITTKLYVP